MMDSFLLKKCALVVPVRGGALLCSAFASGWLRPAPSADSLTLGGVKIDFLLIATSSLSLALDL